MTKKISVAIDVQVLIDHEKTGIGYAIFEIVKSLIARDDLDCTLFYFSHNQSENTFLHSLFPSLPPQSIITKRCFKRQPMLWLIQLFPSLFNRWFCSPDVILSPHHDLLSDGKAKTALIIYDMVFFRYPETMNRRTRRKLRWKQKSNILHTDIVFSISNFTKKEIVECIGIPESKIVSVPLSINTDRFHTGHSSEEMERTRKKYHIPKMYFLYVGTLEPRKNIERLLDAYAILLKNRIDAPVLVIAGKKGWLYNAIFDEVQRLHLENHVLFTGYVEENEVPLLMEGALAFVFVPLYEGFGLPPLEAMACGTPVLTSNAASLPEVVGDSGIMVSPDNCNEMANAMERLISDPNLREQLSQMGIERAKHFSWKKSAEIIADSCKKRVFGVN